MEANELSEFEESQNKSGVDQVSNKPTKGAVAIEDEDKLCDSLDVATTVEITAKMPATHCH